MFPGSPAPLPPGTRLSALLDLPARPIPLGVWLRGVPGLQPVRTAGLPLLLGSDLGALLRRCERVAVRLGGRLSIMPAGDLIRCRVLEVVLGTPFLPPPALLRELYPSLRAEPGVLTLPIGLGSPEEALALCAAARLPVRSTRVGYAAASG